MITSGRKMDLAKLAMIRDEDTKRFPHSEKRAIPKPRNFANRAMISKKIKIGANSKLKKN